MRKKNPLHSQEDRLENRQMDLVDIEGSPFRVAALDGSLDYGTRQAGSANSPLDSRAIGDIGESPVSQTTIDFFSACFTTTVPSRVIDKIGSITENFYDLNSEIRFENMGGSWLSCPGGFGSSVAFKLVAGGEWKARISLPGRACATMSEFRFRELFSYLGSHPDLSVTRLDFKTDAIAGELDLVVIGKCLVDGEYEGFRGGEIVESFGGKRAGKTVYFGGRKSEVRLRFYDKEAESGVVGAGVRQELQLRGKRAMQAYDRIQEKREERICDYGLSRLAGAIRFGVRKGKNLDRFVPAEFWTKWTESIARTGRREPSVQRKSTVSRSLDWFARAASKAVAKAKLVLRASEFTNLIDKMVAYGTSKFRSEEVEEVKIAASQYAEGEYFAFWNEVLVYN